MSLSGFLDYNEPLIDAVHRVLRAVRSTLRNYDYALLEPPVIDPADAFIERSGEAIRERMYLFEDEAGQNLCLRPEMTIPVSRALLRTGWRGEDAARIGYSGPVFRRDVDGPGGFKQFLQAGAECFGPGPRAYNEAEIVAMAISMLHGSGIKAARVRFGDVRLISRLMDRIGLPSHARRDANWLSGQIAAWRNHALTERGIEQQAGARADLEFIRILKDLGTERATALISRFLQISGISVVGARPLEAIVERLTAQLSATIPPLPDAIWQEISALLALKAPAKEALGRIAQAGASIGFETADILHDFRHRFDVMGAAGLDLDTMTIEPGFLRAIEYYTGFVFEVAAEADGQPAQLAGGGRYDALMSQLGGGVSSPAVGFALHTERVMRAADPSVFAKGSLAHGHPDVIVVAGPDADSMQCMQALQHLRQAGFRSSIAHRDPGPKQAAHATLFLENNGTIRQRDERSGAVTSVTLDELSRMAPPARPSLGAEARGQRP